MIEMDRKQVVQVEDLICERPEFFAAYLLEVHWRRDARWVEGASTIKAAETATDADERRLWVVDRWMESRSSILLPPDTGFFSTISP